MFFASRDRFAKALFRLSYRSRFQRIRADFVYRHGYPPFASLRSHARHTTLLTSVQLPCTNVPPTPLAFSDPAACLVVAVPCRAAPTLIGFTCPTISQEPAWVRTEIPALAMRDFVH